MDMNETSTSKPKPGKRFSDGKRGNTKGHHTLNGRANKDRRREEAFAREAAYAKMSLEERLKNLPTEGANRQRARMTAAIAERDAKAAERKKATTDSKAKKVVKNAK
jgi:hypothetical protein